MTCRATEQQVQDLLQTSKTVEQIKPFLAIANNLVTELLAPTSGYGDDLMRDIEASLAAHFTVSTLTKTATEIKIDDATTKFQSGTGLALDSTPHGAMVKTLDYKGLLDKKRGTALLQVMG